uniref:Uncharacterized protein n=1 Tax=Heterorhabditis bacteriophora TaxID=37862 RepID=A0A1I7WCT9_HETBA
MSPRSNHFSMYENGLNPFGSVLMNQLSFLSYNCVKNNAYSPIISGYIQ